MYYGKIEVKTASGWHTKYIKYADPNKFMAYLARYYDGKEYMHQIITEQGAQMLAKGYKKVFREIM